MVYCNELEEPERIYFSEIGPFWIPGRRAGGGRSQNGGARTDLFQCNRSVLPPR